MNKKEIAFSQGRMENWHKPLKQVYAELDQNGYGNITLIKNDKVLYKDSIISSGDRLEILHDLSKEIYNLRITKSDEIVWQLSIQEISLDIKKYAGHKEVIITEG